MSKFFAEMEKFCSKFIRVPNRVKKISEFHSQKPWALMLKQASSLEHYNFESEKHM